MYRSVMIASALLLTVSGVKADTYPTTLLLEEQERHEFIDVQQGNYPGGRNASTPRASLSAKGGVPIIVESTNPYIGVLPNAINDRPVLMTRP